MKKKLYSLLILLILLLSPKIVLAAEPTSDDVKMSLECGSLYENKSSSCKLYATISSNHSMSGLDFIFVPTENASINGLTTSNFSSGVQKAGTKYFLANEEDLEGKVEILRFTLTPTNSSSVTLTYSSINISMDDDKYSISVPTLNKTLTVSTDDSDDDDDTSGGSSGGNTGGSGSGDTSGGSTTGGTTTTQSADATLKALSITGVKFYPTFTPGKYEYTAKTSENSITISATTSDSKAKIISGSGKHTLKDGENTIKVVVQSENGNKTTYTIVVTKVSGNQIGDTEDGGNTEASNEKNPDTGVVSITIISLVVIALSIVVFINRKKLTVFKRI